MSGLLIGVALVSIVTTSLTIVARMIWRTVLSLHGVGEP